MSTSPPREADGIGYARCQPIDVAEMARVLAATFTQHDPPAVAMKLSERDFEDFVHVVAQPPALELTIIARDIASGAMAGALLAEAGRCRRPPGWPRCRKSSHRSSSCSTS